MTTPIETLEHYVIDGQSIADDLVAKAEEQIGDAANYGFTGEMDDAEEVESLATDLKDAFEQAQQALDAYSAKVDEN